MDLKDFLSPVDGDIFTGKQYDKDHLYNCISMHTEKTGIPDLDGVNVALIGVNEERNAVNNEGCANAPDAIREKFYSLRKGDFSVNIVDLGNINSGFTVSDTYFALSTVAYELLSKNVIPVIIGGSQDLTFAQYQAYEKLEQTVNIVSVDSMFDLGTIEESAINSQNYLGKIIIHQPNYLFNFSNIGYQSYFVGSQSVDLMNKLYFDAYRLGQVRTDIEEVEPIVRNADILTFDISSIRYSDAPAAGFPSPHGFYGEEACQIARYAGFSDKLSSFGIYEYNPLRDLNNTTAHLVAHMVWYFIDGVSGRKKDFPVNSKVGFIKYRVVIKNTDHEIIFYKSSRSNRWWMEVPYVTNKIKYERHHIIPCSYKDYQTACEEEMPERWWQAFQKLS